MSEFEWPNGRHLTLAELSAAYKCGAVHEDYSVVIDNDDVSLYVPENIEDRTKPRDAVDEDEEWICVWGDSPSWAMLDLFQTLGISAEFA